ncbi:MAG TPA: DUF2188 domain-containing protein [Solirubrobacteraceae bacterium]|jgi:hypothetical protein
MTGHHLEIRPLSKQHWVFGYEGDPTPLSETPTLEEALAEARIHAKEFGESVLHVHHLDGRVEETLVEPERRAPTPADVKGPHVEPR